MPVKWSRFSTLLRPVKDLFLHSNSTIALTPIAPHHFFIECIGMPRRAYRRGRCFVVGGWWPLLGAGCWGPPSEPSQGADPTTGFQVSRRQPTLTRRTSTLSKRQGGVSHFSWGLQTDVLAGTAAVQRTGRGAFQLSSQDHLLPFNGVVVPVRKAERAGTCAPTLQLEK